VPDANPSFYTHAISDFRAHEFAIEQMPSDVQHQATRVLLDCLGCAAAGSVMPAGQIAAEFAREQNGPMTATVLGCAPANVSMGGSPIQF
jgi:2-methylcitrate dehydratase PrpD